MVFCWLPTIILIYDKCLFARDKLMFFCWLPTIILIYDKCLFAGDKLMPLMHLKQSASLNKSGFTYSACGLFTKNKERIQKLKETRDSRYIYRNELDQSCLQHSIA